MTRCNAVVGFNPAYIPELNGEAEYPDEILAANGAQLCAENSCNINSNRNGTWSCFDINHDLIIDDKVPRNGYCKLGCIHEPSIDVARKIICSKPHLIGPQQYIGLRRTYTEVTKQKWERKYDNDFGWVCEPPVNNLYLHSLSGSVVKPENTADSTCQLYEDTIFDKMIQTYL